MERRPSQSREVVDLSRYRELRKSGFDPTDALDYLDTAAKLRNIAYIEKVDRISRPPDDAA